jgi:hypothetical protein
VRGHKRFRAGAWRLTVNAKDPVTGERKPVYATVHAPNNKRGEARADSELAKLVAQVETGRSQRRPTRAATTNDDLGSGSGKERCSCHASGMWKR